MLGRLSKRRKKTNNFLNVHVTRRIDQSVYLSVFQSSDDDRRYDPMNGLLEQIKSYDTEAFSYKNVVVKLVSHLYYGLTL